MALELLEQHLSPEQLSDLAEHGYFRVLGQDGRWYRILKGCSMNIYAELPPETGFTFQDYHCWPWPQLEEAERMLWAKLVVESNTDVILHNSCSFPINAIGDFTGTVIPHPGFFQPVNYLRPPPLVMQPQAPQQFEE